MPHVIASASIENVVASATLNQNIDLYSVVKAFPHVEYKPEQFPGLVFRLKRPKTSLLIFGSGKLVCTGAKSVRQVRRAVRTTVRQLDEGGILIINRPKIVVQNIVASGSLYGKIDLEKATYVLGRTMYEPEQFPGLIYRMEDPRVVILIFSTGKLVCTGAKQEIDVYRSINILYNQVKREELIFYE
jgi:transcription initiation factor TFIID TATA-box-binding protein